MSIIFTNTGTISSLKKHDHFLYRCFVKQMIQDNTKGPLKLLLMQINPKHAFLHVKWTTKRNLAIPVSILHTDIPEAPPTE